MLALSFQYFGYAMLPFGENCLSFKGFSKIIASALNATKFNRRLLEKGNHVLLAFMIPHHQFLA